METNQLVDINKKAENINNGNMKPLSISVIRKSALRK